MVQHQGKRGDRGTSSVKAAAQQRCRLSSCLFARTCVDIRAGSFCWMKPIMSSVNTSDTITFNTILEQGRKRGYVRRADLEAAIRHQAAAQPDVDSSEQRTDHNDREAGTPSDNSPLDLDSAIDQLLAEDVDIIEDDEEARVQEDEAI